MSLKDTITEDMKSAMRAKDSQRLGTIRLLQAALKQREVDERITLDDAAVVAIVDKLIKQRKDSITQFEAGGRADLVAKERAELQILEAYLPERMGADEIAREVAVLVTALGNELARPIVPADIGRLMAAAKRHFAGKADMASVSAAVKRSLTA